MTVIDSTEHPTHIGDVISYLDCCSDSFGQLAAILRALRVKAGEYSDSSKLIDAGLYIANEFENASDGWKEELKRCGVRGYKLSGEFLGQEGVQLGISEKFAGTEVDHD